MDRETDGQKDGQTSNTRTAAYYDRRLLAMFIRPKKNKPTDTKTDRQTKTNIYMGKQHI